MNMLMIAGIVIVLVLCRGELGSAGVPFDEYYGITYGYNNVKFLNREKSEVRISLDKSSGSGFGSKAKYGSGLFKISAKLPPRDCGGVVTTFYLHSGGSNNHDEVDLEFLGNRQGRPIVLQTNVFANGVGGREQRLVLWFDPSADYHTYKVLWNPHQIVIFIDDTPIRVFKNNTGIGVTYPSQPMQVLASIWDGSNWATDGGKTKVIWDHAPFNADYKNLYINGCHRPSTCSFSKYFWNRKNYWELSRDQERKYHNARKSLSYDYCTDQKRYPVTPPECASNS